MTRKSLAEIGRRFGRRDHSTIFNAIAEMEKRIAADPEFAAEIAALRGDIEAVMRNSAE
jgi:chromosomal replication initiator protein